jgi:hypothetical protein
MRTSRGIIMLSAIALAAACTDNAATSPKGSLLSGLSLSATNDSSPATPPPANDGPGVVHGTVLAQSQPGLSGDTLATAPRVADVKVTVYLAGQTSGEPGAQVASVTTGADGKFTLPSLDAGQYVVTFVPPASSGFNGVYVTGHISANSSQYPWWIILSKK